MKILNIDIKYKTNIKYYLKGNIKKYIKYKYKI